MKALVIVRPHQSSVKHPVIWSNIQLNQIRMSYIILHLSTHLYFTIYKQQIYQIRIVWLQGRLLVTWLYYLIRLDLQINSWRSLHSCPIRSALQENQVSIVLWKLDMSILYSKLGLQVRKHSARGLEVISRCQYIEKLLQMIRIRANAESYCFSWLRYFMVQKLKGLRTSGSWHNFQLL